MTPERRFPIAPVVGTIVLVVLAVGAVLLVQFAAGEWRARAAGMAAVAVLGSAGFFLYRLVRRLDESENRLRGIVESASDAILTVDEFGGIETVNTSTVALFGYRPGQLQGMRFATLLASNHEERDDEHFLAFLDRNGFPADGTPRHAVGLRADGRTLDLDLSASAVSLEAEDIYTVVLRDVGERVAAQAALRKARDELEVRVRERTAELQAANGSLAAEVREHEVTQKQREALIAELRDALEQVKTLSGLLPICANCKKIRDDQGYWSQVEVYIGKHSEAEFSHSICPECVEELYPDLAKDS